MYCLPKISHHILNERGVAMPALVMLLAVLTAGSLFYVSRDKVIPKLTGQNENEANKRVALDSFKPFKPKKVTLESLQSPLPSGTPTVLTLSTDNTHLETTCTATAAATCKPLQLPCNQLGNLCTNLAANASTTTSTGTPVTLYAKANNNKIYKVVVPCSVIKACP